MLEEEGGGGRMGWGVVEGCGVFCNLSWQLIHKDE